MSHAGLGLSTRILQLLRQRNWQELKGWQIISESGLAYRQILFHSLAGASILKGLLFKSSHEIPQWITCCKLAPGFGRPGKAQESCHKYNREIGLKDVHMMCAIASTAASCRDSPRSLLIKPLEDLTAWQGGRCAVRTICWRLCFCLPAGSSLHTAAS